MHKVLICGDRNWKPGYGRCVKTEIKKLVKKHGTTNLLIIVGGAPGIDTLTKMSAHKQNVHVAEIEALWEARGRGAGMQRNEAMAALDPDEVIAIHDSIDESRGTKGMLKMAEKRGIPHRLVSP